MPETYAMVGYEIYYAPDLGVFAGTGAGYDGPRELSGWYTSIYSIRLTSRQAT